jgi:AcrR family transcriptional regulator
LAKKTTSSVLNKAGRKKPVQPSQAAKTPPSSTGRTGPKPTLTKDQIACAAIAIADSDGLEGISMQRVARAVGVTTMALYRYFSSKTELIELMIEIAGGPEPNLDTIAPGWSSSLAEWAHQCSAIYRRRPWFLQATMTPGRKMGPNELEVRQFLHNLAHILRVVAVRNQQRIFVSTITRFSTPTSATNFFGLKM